MKKYKFIKGVVDRTPILVNVLVKTYRGRFNCRIEFPAYSKVAIVGRARGIGFNTLMYIDLRYMLNDFIQFAQIDSSGHRFDRVCVTAIFDKEQDKKVFLNARRRSSMESSLKCFKSLSVIKQSIDNFSRTSSAVELPHRVPINLIGWKLINTNS